MYRVLKNGFTACGEVWMAGHIIPLDIAVTYKFDLWFEQTKGFKKGVQWVEVEQTPVTVTAPKAVMTGLEKEVFEKGLTLVEARQLNWRDKCKKLGLNLAKRVKDDKSNNA